MKKEGEKRMALDRILSGMLNDFKSSFSLEDIKDVGKSFEYLVNYLIVSKYHPDAFPDRGDLDRLVVDEKGQFGLDAIAVIINGNLVLSKEDIACYTKSRKLDVDIIFIQTKTEDKCDTGDFLKTIQATKNFLKDFELVTEKNENICNVKEIIDTIFEYDNYRHCLSDSPRCHIYYACAANMWDANLIDNICRTNEKEIKESITDIKDVNIRVLGRDYLINAYQEIKNSMSVKIYLKNCLTLDKIQGVNEAYLGYISGEEYLKIIMNDEGELRRRIFYENVRDYQGMNNHVNQEIRNTIKDTNTRGQFVLLNNGVTIITRALTPLGGNEYELSDFQVVNGCQTSNEIYNMRDYSKEILIPIKVIYTTDVDIIASIVRATNRQSPVPEEAFVALDKYHKNLQILFEEYSKDMPLEVFYERRPGEPDNIRNKYGKYQIITLHGIIRAVTSVYFQDAHIVYNNNPANILRNRNEKLFCVDHKPEMYFISAYLFVQFVYLQQKGILNKQDYVYRFYIIMVVYSLLINNTRVPEFNSKELDKQNKKVIESLKKELETYFTSAKTIVLETLSEEGFKEKRKIDVLKSSDFCNRVKENAKHYLQN